VLDAQYFGVAQRRRRVFVVGCLGDWRHAAAVLFERHSMSGNPAPSREKKEGVAKCAKTSARERSHWDGDYPHPTLSQSANSGGVGYSNQELFSQRGAYLTSAHPIALAENTIGRLPENGGNGDGFTVGGPMYTLNATGVHGVAHPIAFAQNQLGEVRIGEVLNTLNTNSNASGCNTPMVAQPITQYGKLAGSLTARYDSSPCADRGANVVMQPITMRESGHGYWMKDEIAGTLRAEGEDRPSRPSHVICNTMRVRRLTPVECERLQGFPDNYTNIPKAADGPRYKALGNSMAVPVMHWIGKRIQMVEDLC